jgi:hypothetical protein
MITIAVVETVKDKWTLLDLVFHMREYNEKHLALLDVPELKQFTITYI